MATPPFNPDETKPQGSDLISNYPAAERTFRDVIESWLLVEHNRDGQHDQVTLEDRDTAEPAGVSGHLTIFNDAGVPSFRDGTGVIQTFLTGTVQTADIADDAVTYAKIQDVSATNRFLGRVSAGAGVIEELTGTQATTLLDAFTSSLKGLAPASGGGTTNFLRADGTWAAPPVTGPKIVVKLTDLGTATPTVTTTLNNQGALSATRNGAGDYTFSWTDALTNPAAQLAVRRPSAFSNNMIINVHKTGGVSSTSVRISAEDSGNTANDPEEIYITIYGQ